MSHEGNIKTLPKWAQQRIEALVRDLADAQAKFYMSTQKPTKNSVIIVNPYSVNYSFALDPQATIHFITGKSPSDFLGISRGTAPNQVLISGGTEISIHPHAANTVTVEVRG